MPRKQKVNLSGKKVVIKEERVKSVQQKLPTQGFGN